MGSTVLEPWCVRLGVAAYLVATIVSLPGVRAWRHAPPLRWMGLAGGVLATGVALGLRWTAAGQGPFLTLYEVLVSNLFSIGVVFAAAARADTVARRCALPVFAMLAVLGVWALTLPADVAPLPPTFASPWLWAHVFAGKLFLGLCLVAASAGVLLQSRPEDLGVLLGLWRFAALAFVFDSAMLLAGALWARGAWGHYWNWDPVETWALVTWLALGALLHARSAFRMPPRAVGVLMVGVFVLAVLTFLGVPFFSHAPHKGIV